MSMSEMVWTREQAAAVTASGDVLLAASAGTGKTTTVVGKILWALGLDVGRDAEGRPLPRCPAPCRLDEVAAITFTEKAAYDLKRKLRDQIHRSDAGARLLWDLERASVGTIHAFCGELLREHSLRLGIDPTFRILDEREARIQQDEIIRDVIMQGLEAEEPSSALLVRRFNLYDRTFHRGGVGQVREVLRDIRWHAGRYDAWVRRGAGPQDVPTLDVEELRVLAARSGIEVPAGEDGSGEAESLELSAALYRVAHRSLARWLAWLEQENVRDFDSLILDARRLLTRESTRPALQAVRARYRLLVIDEFQDTDAAQRDIAFAICGLGETPPVPAEKRPQLFLVGDPQQSIYGFRGADISVWNAVRDRLCEGEPLRLTHNFRSEAQVVDVVNRVCSRVMTERAAALAAEMPERVVEYSMLRAARRRSVAAGTEWLAGEGSRAAELDEVEGRLIASRIRDMVGSELVADPETGRLRPCRLRDIAILARRRESLSALEPGLRQYGIGHFNSATRGLAGRQEVLDIVTALRVVENPSDDLRMFAFLRSPFVGLRDEVLARIRLEPRTASEDRGESPSYLAQAERFLKAVSDGAVSLFQAPESPAVGEVELRALSTGLDVIRDAHGLVDRADHAEIMEALLERTGYRLHLLLRDGAAEALANLERFQAVLSEYRHLSLGAFLRLWDRWGEQDLGIPQAPLFSQDDDVVTLSTIHTAKGLEWPVVILARMRDGPADGRMLTNTYWSDPELGPVFLPPKAQRGARSERALERAIAAENAEEARLIYVAATRARDRLIIVGPAEVPTGFAAWLAPALEGAIEAHEAEGRLETLRAVGRSEAGRAARDDLRARLPDAATRTGSQIDAFGFDHEPEDENGQFSLFGGGGASPAGGATDAPPGLPDSLPTVIRRAARPIQQSLSEMPISLTWLDGYETDELPDLAGPVTAGALRFGTSATELRMRDRDPAEWELRYRHGVIPTEEFAPSRESAGLPPTVRGALIHGVLERIEAEAELGRILNEAIAGLDLPESEALLEPGTAYRAALEEEIAAVVRSPEWEWYVDGAHWRELSFLHVMGAREWRIGAFDLYRPARPGAVPGAPDAAPCIVDFKTHQIDAADVEPTAADYAVQMRVYREATRAIMAPVSGVSPPGAEPEVRVLLHFTRPNVALEV